MNVASLDPAPVAAPRPQLFRLTVRRELNRTFLIILLLAPVVTIAAASQAVGMEPGFGLTQRLLRRFDITVFIMSVLIAMLRVSVRVENDGREQWLDPLMASGARRAAYPLGVLTGVILTTAAAYAIVAVTFAVSVHIIGRTPELLHALPGTLARGLYILGHWTLWATVIAVLLRSAPLSFGVAVIVGLLPWAAVSMVAFDADLPPAGLVRIGLLSPPLQPNSFTLPWNISTAVLMVVLIIMSAQRFTGRRL